MTEHTHSAATGNVIMLMHHEPQAAIQIITDAGMYQHLHDKAHRITAQQNANA